MKTRNLVLLTIALLSTSVSFSQTYRGTYKGTLTSYELGISMVKINFHYIVTSNENFAYVVAIYDNINTPFVKADGGNDTVFIDYKKGLVYKFEDKKYFPIIKSNITDTVTGYSNKRILKIINSKSDVLKLRVDTSLPGHMQPGIFIHNNRFGVVELNSQNCTRKLVNVKKTVFNFNTIKAKVAKYKYSDKPTELML